ncbi:arginine/serine-rich coiled-coil protein 2 isoform X2 [Triplophysa rosa]|uniref:arginine/serine-rich coiled-coil protein 2 isoform X2 n=1 Tax=Triplophysa rosa TaxID=992332 RepID=UPI002546346F|nr:arginine/serine-rich coiled-coil protein 2 isoform X2 [Triplophysa rosa]
MAANDADFSGALSGKSQSDEDRRRYGPESSKASRNSKHNSRSRSRSVERKRKSGDKRHRRSRSRSKEVRRKDSLKCRSGSEEPELSDKGRDRLSEDMEERQRRKERKSSRTRSTSRSRSRERRHHNRNWDKRRSRSRSGDRRSKSHEKKRRGRSQSNSKGKHRHRSRSHSKSRLDRAKKLQEQKEKELLDKQQQDRAAAAAPLSCDTVTAAAGPALNVAALLASGTQVTPQIAMAAQMAALQAKTLAETGIAVPSYYNPSAVNPMKFAEQEKKRKRLWQGKKEGDKSQTAELWEKLSFGNKDQNVKFRKLMGIKGEEESGPSGAVNEEGMKTLQQQEEMFRNLDVQYEMARSQTHTQRGMGLGFSSSFSSRGMDAV